MITRTIMVKNTKNKYKLPEKLVKNIVKDFLRQINAALLNKEMVWIRHLGVFRVKKGKARTGRNVKTGMLVNIPAQYRVKFKVCRIMKDRLNA